VVEHKEIPLEIREKVQDHGLTNDILLYMLLVVHHTTKEYEPMRHHITPTKKSKRKPENAKLRKLWNEHCKLILAGDKSENTDCRREYYSRAQVIYRNYKTAGGLR